MPYCETSEIQTYYEIKGDKGDYLVLIPGTVGDTLMWGDGFVHPLQEQFRLLLYDPRCAGRTDWPDEKFTMDQFVEDLKDLLDNLSISQAHLYGISLGSVIAQHFTIKYPKMVNKVILAASTPHQSFLTEKGRDFYTNLQAGDFLETSLEVYSYLMGSEEFETQKQALTKLIQTRAEYRENIGYPSARVSQHCIENHRDAIWKARDTTEDLKKLDTEFLVLKPEQDNLIDPQASEYLHSILSNSMIIRYQDGIHAVLPPMNNRDMDPVIDFLTT